MVIILLGMPGCGKTSTGAYLAKALNYKFIDLDSYLENSHDISIAEIFKNFGEEYFRSLENQALHTILSDNNINNLVLSLGGGTYINDNNKELCNKYLTIWLNPSLDTILNRLKQQPISMRPLLQDTNLLDKLETLYSQRYDHYNQSKYSLNISCKDNLEIIANKIINLL